MKKLKYWAEFSFVRLMEGFFRLLPWGTACRWGERTGLLFSRLMPKRDKLIFENLRCAFPHQSEEELKGISRSVWMNLGRTAVEFIRMDEINSSNFKQVFEFEGEEILSKAAQQGKGVILVGFHMTNWEYTGLGIGLRFGQVSAVARPMKNPLVDDWVQSKRRHAGLEVLLHRNAVKEGLKALKQKKILGILVDQNLYQGGVFVDFFGRPAATTPLPALLRERTGAPVLIVYSLRRGDKFRNIYIGPLEFPVVSDPKERLLVHTQFVNNEIEKVVRRHPEGWFWIHNRWKRKPNEGD